VLKNPVESEIYKVARQQGLITMKEDAVRKMMQKIIPFEEINEL
jgi:type II secretory ATPase GspE/PulE/Tfp pilus assembly ATPase PilB-like protein